MDLLDQLKGGNLRSLGNVKQVINRVKGQAEFDVLIEGLFHEKPVVQMRSVDVIEKVTHENRREYLSPHKETFLQLMETTEVKQVKWHLALIASRLELCEKETVKVWNLLTDWALNKNESRIVRVNSIQGLFELTQNYPALKQDLVVTLKELEHQRIPSIRARIRKLREKL